MIEALFHELKKDNLSIKRQPIECSARRIKKDPFVKIYEYVVKIIY